MLVVALISSRLWLAQQSALENAAQQMPAAQTATVLPPAAKVTPAPSPALPNHPELLPKPERSLEKGERWRPGDSLEQSKPADWTTPPRFTNPDPEMISALHEAGLNPEVLRHSGNLRVQRQWQGGRSQVALVESSVSRFAGKDWRTVYAIAQRSPSIDPGLAARLIAANARSTLSNWSWDRGYWLAEARVPASARRDVLISAVEHVLIAADDLEKELSGDLDEF